MDVNNAVCRGCGLILKGKPYQLGGSAYHPKTGKNCPSNQYGGFVCSYLCDYEASLRMIRSMPGCADATKPDDYARRKIRNNWPED